MATNTPILTVAVSVRALFNTEESHRIFLEGGQGAFDAYMRKKERIPLRPGVAFPLVKKLLALNSDGQRLVEVILMSRTSPEAGVRILASLKHYELDIMRVVMTTGGDRFKFAKHMGVQLFLSAQGEDVAKAMDAGVAAATFIPSAPKQELADPVVRFALDGDSVLFGDEAERIYQAEGLAAFQASELKKAKQPLAAGPFKPVLEAISALQKECPGKIETGLITARGAMSAERVLYTLRDWQMSVDTLIFADGRPKGPLLSAFGADIFFDDGVKNIESAKDVVAAGHVPALTPAMTAG